MDPYIVYYIFGIYFRIMNIQDYGLSLRSQALGILKAGETAKNVECQHLISSEMA